MGSYHRITIAFVLIVCMVGLSAACRGDGTLCSSNTMAPSNSPSTPQRATTSDNDMYTIVGTTIITIREEINKDSSPVTPAQRTPTTLTSAPESTNGTTATTQNVTPTMVSSKASPAALVSQSVPTGLPDVTEDIETGTTASVEDGTGGEETIQTTQSELEDGTGGEETIQTTQSELEDGTGGEETIQTTQSELEDGTGGEETIQTTQSELEDGTGGKETIQTTQSELMTNGVDVTTGPVRPDLEEDWTTPVNEILTSKLAVITEDIITARDELPTTTRDVPSPIEYADITTVPTLEITRKDGTTDSDMVTTTLATTLGKQATTQFASTSEILTTSDHITAAPLTTPERATTSMIHSSLPPTPGSQASTQSLSTSHLLQTTDNDHHSNRISASELSSEDLENIVTLQFRGTCITEKDWFSRYDVIFREYLSTTLSSDTLTVQPDCLYYIKPTPLDDNNILYVSFIARSSSAHKRSTMPVVSSNETLGALSNLTAFTEALGIPLSQTPTISTVLPDFIQNTLPAETTEEPLTTRNLPDFIQETLPAETTEEPLTTRNLPDFIQETLPAETTEEPLTTRNLPDFIQNTLPAETTEEPLTTRNLPDFIQETLPAETTEESLTTRKPPPTIGFLSNPGLFISLVVIATVSTIIIIVGLIYLLCDRRRSRSGEYITNRTPRNSDLELGFDNPVMAENDKAVSNGNHLSSIKGEMESDMIVPYDNFTQEELMNYEVEDTHL